MRAAHFVVPVQPAEMHTSAPIAACLSLCAETVGCLPTVARIAKLTASHAQPYHGQAVASEIEKETGRGCPAWCPLF